MPKLDNWFVTTLSPYSAPEEGIRISGNVTGHPTHEDGKLIRTTRLVAASGRTVTTRSGSVYELGEPEPEYVEWLRTEFGREIDSTNPILVKNEDDYDRDNDAGKGSGNQVDPQG